MSDHVAAPRCKTVGLQSPAHTGSQTLSLAHKHDALINITIRARTWDACCLSMKRPASGAGRIEVGSRAPTLGERRRATDAHPRWVSVGGRGVPGARGTLTDRPRALARCSSLQRRCCRGGPSKPSAGRISKRGAAAPLRLSARRAASRRRPHPLRGCCCRSLAYLSCRPHGHVLTSLRGPPASADGPRARPRRVRATGEAVPAPARV